jgi:AraC-like DNA-binding protein
LLRVGTHVTALPAEPVGAALLAARDGPSLIERWQRLERYVHLRHPIRAERLTATTAHLSHPRAQDDDHSAAMDLVLAGLIAGLLTAVGCADLTLELGRGATRVLAMDRAEISLQGALPPRLATDQWHYRWIAPSRTNKSPLETKSVPHRPDLMSDLKALFARDLVHLWSLGETARHLGLSTRTLQRRLAADGTTLQGLRRATQIDHATHLLLTTDHSLTSIGYACGFADSAHFTRAFKTAAGMPPAAYRAATKAP